MYCMIANVSIDMSHHRGNTVQERDSQPIRSCKRIVDLAHIWRTLEDSVDRVSDQYSNIRCETDIRLT